MNNERLTLPIAFKPVYMSTVWGGRRLENWRDDLPEGPIGESWELADHERGMAVVHGGAFDGRTLRSLCSEFGTQLVGESYEGGDFPLLIKIIDANDRLSVQVHPDDALAVELGVGVRGKTECWLMAGDGGELFQGTTAGTDQAGFEAALAEDRVEDCLNRFETSDGDFFFLPARTVHALGTGCLLVEVQQTSDITFRVSDWGRMGLDGKPRPLHVSESLATIDFSKSDHGPVKAAPEEHPDGGSVRRLVTCPYFTVEERRALRTVGGRSGQCSVVVNLSRAGSLATAGGRVALPAFSTVLVPAAAGPWTAVADGAEPLRLVVAHPV